jgi:hypothetical protein
LKRKVIRVIAVVLSILAFNGFAFSGASQAAVIEDIYGTGLHLCATDLVENKAVYDMALFSHIEFWVVVEGELTQQDKDSEGNLTIENGSYYYYDYDGNRVNVNGENKTFALHLDYEEPGYYEFFPKINNRNVLFYGATDGGLQGKWFVYSLLGEEEEVTVPNYRTFSQQMATYVPYVERDTSGRNYTFRMVNPNSPQTPLAVPVEGRYRLRMRDASGDTLFRSGWKDCQAGESPAYSVTLPSDVNPQEIANILADVLLYDDPNKPNFRHRYIWRFDVCTETNDGITAASIPQSPLTVAVGEEVEVRITFKDGYRGESTTSNEPIFISDRAVLDSNSWSYDPDTKEGVFKLKGLKSGRTRYAIGYSVDADTYGWYHTSFVDVVVGDGSSSGGSGGGGGCNALGGAFAALALGAAALATRKRGQKG